MVDLAVVSLFKEADESLNFEEQILEAAKAITAATVALVKSASAAQKELVASGRVSHVSRQFMHFLFSCWSNALLSSHCSFMILYCC